MVLKKVLYGGCIDGSRPVDVRTRARASRSVPMSMDDVDGVLGEW